MNPLLKMLSEERRMLPNLILSQFDKSRNTKFDYPCYIISGAGDSFAAGLILKNYIEQLSVIDSPLDLIYSKMLKRAVKADCALIAISMGGRTRSLVELTKKYRFLGGKVIAVTSNRDSPLAKASSETLDIIYGKTIMYSGVGRQAVLLAGLAGSFGKEKIEIEETREEKDNCPLFYKPETNVGISGSLGTALFSTLKSYEYYGTPSITISMEELMHAYIYGVPKTYNIFLPPNLKKEEILEKINLLKDIGEKVNFISCKDNYWQTMLYQTIKTIDCLIESVSKRNILKPKFTTHQKLEELTKTIYIV